MFTFLRRIGPIKIIGILLILAVIVVCSGFYLFTNDYDFDAKYKKSDINTSLLESTRLENEDKTISILPPKQSNSSLRDGQIEINLIKQLDEDLAPSIISLERSSSRSYNLYSEDGIKSLTSSLESSLKELDFDILKVYKVEGIGQQAIIIELSFLNNGIKTRSYNLYAKTDAGLISVIATSQFSKWDDNKSLLLSSVLSTEIK